MEKFIINTEALFIKNILISDEYVKISDENYNTKDVFLEKINADKKGVLDTRYIISFSKITKIVPFETEKGIQLFFVEKEKKEKTYLEFNSLEEYTEVLGNITDKANHLVLQTIPNKSISNWIKQAGYTLISLMFTLAIVFRAKDLEAGNTVTISGGKRGLKRIMLFIAETLGTFNSMLICTIVTLCFLYWTYKKYSKGDGFVNVYQ